MDPAALINLALLALQGILNLIASIKGQSGMTDDEILAAAQQITASNDNLYATLKAALAANNPPISVPPPTA